MPQWCIFDDLIPQIVNWEREFGYNYKRIRKENSPQLSQAGSNVNLTSQHAIKFHLITRFQ